MADLPIFPRNMLETVFNGDQRMINSFEVLLNLLSQTITTAELASGAAGTVVTAQFVVTAPDDGLPAASVLTEGQGIDISGATVSIDPLEAPLISGSQPVTFISTAPTILALPTTGTVMTTATLLQFFQQLAASPSYADDAAAAAGGVAVGSPYRNGSIVQVRVT